MRQADIYFKDEKAGTLTQKDDRGFLFQYHEHWIADDRKPPISLTLPKTSQPYTSDYLFPFFYHMLPEGANKQVVCTHLRIDEDDDFGILLNTARVDNIGAVTIRKLPVDL